MAVIVKLAIVLVFLLFAAIVVDAVLNYATKTNAGIDQLAEKMAKSK